MAKKSKIKIIWSNKALNLLLEITSFIADKISLSKANEFQLEIFSFVTEKLTHPERNPPCRFVKLKEAGYRCLNFKKKYIIVYRVQQNNVLIIAIVASRRNPDFFNGLVD